MRLSTRIIIAILIFNYSVQDVTSDALPLRAMKDSPRSLDQVEEEDPVTGEEGDQPKVSEPDPLDLAPRGNEPNEVPEGGEENQEEEGGSDIGSQGIQGGGGEDDDDGDSGLLLPVLLLGLALGTYMVRKRFLDNGSYQNTRWIVGSKSDDESEYNTGTLDRRQEMVPLSNDDEWAWEDNARRDLEMGVNVNDEEEDLQAALEMPPKSSERNGGVKRNSINNMSSGASMGGSSIKSTEKSVSNSIKSSTSASTSSSSTHSAPSSAPAPKIVPPKQKKSPPMAPKTAPVLSVEDMLKEQSMMSGGNVPVITSLSKPAARAKPRSTAKKPKTNDDDIFASMGLSSNIGKINSSTHSNVSAPANLTASAPAMKSAPVVAEKAESTGWSSNAESDWGDDCDLDDLISDDENGI